MSHFRKSFHYHKDRIYILGCLGKNENKNHGDVYPRHVQNGERVYKLWGCTLDLTFLHAIHLSQKLCTDLRMWGQKKCSCNVSKVLATPKCPIRPPPCTSLTRDCLKDPWGTQSLFHLKRKASCMKKSLCPPFEHS